MRTAAGAAVAAARGGEGPQFLVALTYRHLGHSKSDPGDYRPKEEVARWKARDPLGVTRAQLLEELGVPEADVDAERDRAEREIQEAVAAALSAPYPDRATDAAREYAP